MSPTVHLRRAFSSRTALLLALVVMLAASAVTLLGILRHGRPSSPSQLELAGIGFTIGAVLAALVALRALGSDLRAQREVAAALQISERKFAGILSIAADAIISVDDSQTIVHFNHGAENIFGYQEAEVLGKPLSMMLPGRYHAVHERHLRHFAATGGVARRMGERSEIFGVRRSGQEFAAEASISRLAVGDGHLFTVVLRDISERIRQQEDERFLARSSSSVATTLDYESVLLSVVHLAVPRLADCCVLDLFSDDGGPVRRVVSVHDDPELTRRLRELETRRVESPHWPFPVAMAQAQGSAIVRNGLEPGWEREGSAGGSTEQVIAALHIRAMLSVPLNARGRAIGTLTMLSTEPGPSYGQDARALAESLARIVASAIDNASLYHTAQRATVARDEILGVVSHDLRNPLSAITMCGGVLLHDLEPSPAQRAELVRTILESTELMNRLIQDLLDVAVIESGHLAVNPARERVPPLVDRVMGMVQAAASERGVTLRAKIPEDFPDLHIDAMRMAQVLANLVGNGVKFTERGGSVTIEAELRGGSALLSVRDTGSGIPADHLPHIFDRYWHARRTARTIGTGLGLAIARGIVEAHGGVIGVTSEEGVGSTFIVSLPMQTRISSVEPPSDAKSPARSS